MLGEKMMISIMAKEVGASEEYVSIYGVHNVFGEKEVLRLGGHTLVSCDGIISISEPVYGSFEDDGEISYRNRIIEHKNEYSETAATVEHSSK